MSLTIKHNKTATLPDQPGVEINKAEWNDLHSVVGTIDQNQNNIAVDGTTITGAGTPASPLVAAGNGSVTIGASVAGGTANSILYVNPSGNVGQTNPGFTYNQTTSTLANTGTSNLGNYTLSVNTLSNTVANAILNLNGTSILGGAGSGAGSNSALEVSRNNTATPAIFSVNSNGITAASGTQSAAGIWPTIAQTGTAGYNGLFVSPFESSTGSGTKYLINAGTNSAANGAGTHTPRFVTDDSGNVAMSGSRLGIGNAAAGGTASNIWITGGQSGSAAFGAPGVGGLRIDAATYSSGATAGSPAQAAVHYVGTPVLAATNAQAITNASTLYIDGAPVASTNVTAANLWALYVNSGNTFLNNNVAVGSRLGVGSASTGGAQLTIGSGITSGATYGIGGLTAFAILAETINSTAVTASTSQAGAATFDIVTYTATNAQTITNLSTIYIAGPPVASTGVTASNLYSFYINSGTSLFNGFTALAGGFGTASNVSSVANLFVGSSNGINTNSATGSLQYGGGTNVSYRSVFNGSTSATIVAANSYGGLIIGSQPVTTPSTGTNPWLSNMVVNPIGTITSGGAAITNTAALYVGAAASAGTNNYSIFANGPVAATTFNGVALTTAGSSTSFLNAAGSYSTPSSGTVTSVSVVTANGVSGTVATATTTPAITLTLGAITPTSVAATGSVTGSNLSGTNTGDQTTITGNAGTATKLQTARNIAGTSFDGSANVTLANKFIVQGTTDTGLTGAQFLGSLSTGLVKNTTSTGVLSIATSGTDYSAGTSALSTGVLKSTTTTGALTIAVAADFPTLNQNTTGNAATVTTNANLTGAVTSVGNATSLGSFTSSQLSTALTDETGSGSAVFGTSPTLTTPNIVGDTTGGNAAAGSVGEFLSTTLATGSAVSLTSSTDATVVSVTLTAGDWDLWAQLNVKGGATTIVGGVTGALGIAAASVLDASDGFSTQFFNSSAPFGTISSIAMALAPRRISISTSTTYYLCVVSNFATSTMSAYGSIQARRRR